MKVWKKIVIANLVVTLIIMGYFIYTALPFLHIKATKTEWQTYEKTLALWCPYADERITGYPVGSIYVNIVVLTNDVCAPYPQYENDKDREWLSYVEVYAKAKNNSYILLVSSSELERNAMLCNCNGTMYDGSFFSAHISYEDKTACPLLLTNPRNGSDASGKLIRYDIDVYAIGHYKKPIYTEYDTITYYFLIESIYRGLKYSVIITVIIWILAFIIWVIAHNIIGFVKWLKR